MLSFYINICWTSLESLFHFRACTSTSNYVLALATENFVVGQSQEEHLPQSHPDSSWKRDFSPLWKRGKNKL